MRTRSRFYVIPTSKDLGEKQRLSTAQANFYLERLWLTISTKIKEDCVYIDPTWMIQFTEQPNGRKKVLKWIRKKDLFKRRYAFFPLCLWNHWVLVIICNPGDSFENTYQRPSILFLDSLNGLLKKDFEKVIASLLSEIYKDIIHASNVISEFITLTPSVPRQNDNTKCGYFVLYYMTLFLKNCPQKFDVLAGYPYFMTKNWFSLDELDTFRNSLLIIFDRIDDYNVPIRTGFLVNGFDNDKDTLRIINLCNETTDDAHLLGPETRGNNNKKRIRDESVQKPIYVEREKNKEKASKDLKVISRTLKDKQSSSTGHKKLLMKLNPKLFDNILDNLTYAQEKWVNMTGLGKLLSFKMSSYPLVLGHSLASNFNEKDCSINIDGKVYKITESDVHDIFGFPKGSRKVEFLSDSEVKKNWRKQYGIFGEHKRVEIWKVVDNFCKSTILDENFKRNFISLLITMLIEIPDNSFIRQHLIGFSGDLEDCSSYNWCEYLISSLKEKHKIWLRNTETRYYTGSLPFLVFFFLRIIVPDHCLDARCIPGYMNWSEYSLKKVEAFLIKKDCLSGGKIKKPEIDKEIMKSWRIMEDTEYNLYSDDDMKSGKSTSIPESKSKGKKLLKIERTSAIENCDQQELNILLEKYLDDYQVLQNSILTQLGAAQSNGKLNDGLLPLKEKFVELNNASNWAAEEKFGSPEAHVYVDKLNASLCSKRVNGSI